MKINKLMLRSLIKEILLKEGASSLTKSNIESAFELTDNKLIFDSKKPGGAAIAFKLDELLDDPAGMRDEFGSIAEDITTYVYLPPDTQNLNDVLPIADSPAADVVGMNWPSVPVISDNDCEFPQSIETGGTISVKSTHIGSSGEFTTNLAPLVKLIGWQIKQSEFTNWGNFQELKYALDASSSQDEFANIFSSKLKPGQKVSIGFGLTYFEFDPFKNAEKETAQGVVLKLNLLPVLTNIDTSIEKMSAKSPKPGVGIISLAKETAKLLTGDVKKVSVDSFDGSQAYDDDYYNDVLARGGRRKQAAAKQTYTSILSCFASALMDTFYLHYPKLVGQVSDFEALITAITSDSIILNDFIANLTQYWQSSQISSLNIFNQNIESFLKNLHQFLDFNPDSKPFKKITGSPDQNKAVGTLYYADPANNKLEISKNNSGLLKVKLNNNVISQSGLSSKTSFIITEEIDFEFNGLTLGKYYFARGNYSELLTKSYKDWQDSLASISVDTSSPYGGAGTQSEMGLTTAGGVTPIVLEQDVIDGLNDIIKVNEELLEGLNYLKANQMPNSNTETVVKFLRAQLNLLCINITGEEIVDVKMKAEREKLKVVLGTDPNKDQLASLRSEIKKTLNRVTRAYNDKTNNLEKLSLCLEKLDVWYQDVNSNGSKEKVKRVVQHLISFLDTGTLTSQNLDNLNILLEKLYSFSDYLKLSKVSIELNSLLDLINLIFVANAIEEIQQEYAPDALDVDTFDQTQLAPAMAAEGNNKMKKKYSLLDLLEEQMVPMPALGAGSAQYDSRRVEDPFDMDMDTQSILGLIGADEVDIDETDVDTDLDGLPNRVDDEDDTPAGFGDMMERFLMNTHQKEDDYKKEKQERQYGLSHAALLKKKYYGRY